MSRVRRPWQRIGRGGIPPAIGTREPFVALLCNERIPRFSFRGKLKIDVPLAAIESVLNPRQKRSESMFPRGDRSKVYIDRKQERFDNRSWSEVAVEEAQIPRITWHGLRHTFCSWLAMAGATTREIMEAAGHKTLSQAARYAHLSPKHTQSAVDRIVGTR